MNFGRGRKEFDWRIADSYLQLFTATDLLTYPLLSELIKFVVTYTFVVDQRIVLKF